ncbi:MAG: DNA primase [Halanaerobium sp.]|nr:DNA primase [Halanaerobium sp.]
MSPMDNSIKEDIKAACDIVDVVAEYVQLKKVGKNYQGLCPFHQEKTPSFTVNPERQFYYCFGCGAGGDVFEFLMEIENMSFPEVLKELARRSGIQLPENPGYSAEESQRRDKIFKINELAGRFYHYLLTEHQLGQKALEYLQERGFARETIAEFQLGYAPRRWDALLNFLQEKGFTREEVGEAGLAIQRRGEKGFYDRFRERVIFPIANSRGQLIGFGGRVLASGQQPKYLNSPQTPVFNKSKVLYGLAQSREEMRRNGEAIIVEGYTDMLALYQAGFRNVVASLGTSLTEDQALILKRYAVTANIAYDADTAGAKATHRGLDILKRAGLQVKVVDLPEGEDPDQILQEKGPDSFREFLDNTISLPEYRIKQVVKKKDLTKLEEKVAAVKELIPVFANIDNAVERDLLMEQVGNMLDIPLYSLQEDLNRYLHKKSKKKDSMSQKWNTKESIVKIRVPGRNIIEGELIKLLIIHPRLQEKVAEELQVENFASKPVQKIYDKIKNGKSFSEIYQELDEGDKDILLKYGVKDEEIAEEKAEERLSELITILNREELLIAKEKLYRQIEKNGKKGSLEYLNKLLQQYHSLVVQKDRNAGKEG